MCATQIKTNIYSGFEQPKRLGCREAASRRGFRQLGASINRELTMTIVDMSNGPVDLDIDISDLESKRGPLMVVKTMKGELESIITEVFDSVIDAQVNDASTSVDVFFNEHMAHGDGVWGTLSIHDGGEFVVRIQWSWNESKIRSTLRAKLQSLPILGWVKGSIGYVDRSGNPMS